MGIIDTVRVTIKQLSQDSIARFWMKVNEMPGGCWEWQGQQNPEGYGVYEMRTCDGGRIKGLAHRIAYEFYNGSLSPNVQVRHMCRNRKCCNPKHMLTGTNFDNVLDREVDMGRITAFQRYLRQSKRPTESADPYGEYRMPQGLSPKMELLYGSILIMMSQGKAISQIAEELKVDPRTIKRARRRMRVTSVDACTSPVTP